MDISKVVALAERVEADLNQLRQRSTLVVMFVDLVGSTQFKADHPSEEIWLTRLAKFLLGVTRIVEADGRVVKYNGDEVMAVFEGDGAPLAAEHAAERILQFCEGLSGQRIAAKLAIDYGEVSLLDFSQGRSKAASSRPPLHSADPNGLVVDRCARLMSKSIAGAVLCSAEFRAASRSPERWGLLGTFQAKGFVQRIEVYSLKMRGAPEFVVGETSMTLAECEKELKKVQMQLAELQELTRKTGR